jgi:hypothetical protein
MSKEERQNPESKRYAELKGKRVVVVTDIPLFSMVRGDLVWVDMFTIGLGNLYSLTNPPLPGLLEQVWLCGKSHIVLIGEAA